MMTATSSGWPFLSDSFVYISFPAFNITRERGPKSIVTLSWREIRRRHATRFRGRARKPQELYPVPKPEPLARK